jgi:hypothetical protein
MALIWCIVMHVSRISNTMQKWPVLSGVVWEMSPRIYHRGCLPALDTTTESYFEVTDFVTRTNIPLRSFISVKPTNSPW